MKVLLLKDVFKLGLAGEVKKVADGYGRNYLIPQGMATLASPGALKQADRIRAAAEAERARLNQELTSVHSQLDGLQLNFPMKAGETGKLYGSVTTQMISDRIEEESGIQVDRSQIDSEALKSIGAHNVSIRLTMDLIPELLIVVHNEDLPPESAMEVAEVEEEIGAFTDLQAELEAEEAELLAAEEEGEQEPFAEFEDEQLPEEAVEDAYSVEETEQDVD